MVGQELLHTGRLDIYLEIVETDVVIVIVWHILRSIPYFIVEIRIFLPLKIIHKNIAIKYQRIVTLYEFNYKNTLIVIYTKYF